MNILHVLQSFPPDSRGGTETYVQTLATAQRAAGDEVRVLAGSDERSLPGGTADERAEGLDVTRVRAPQRDLARLEGLDAVPRQALLDRLERTRPDVVHLHHWHNLSSDLAATCARAGTPVVATLHDYFATCPFFFRLPDAHEPCAPELERAVCVRCIGRVAGDPADVLDAALQRRERHFAAELASARAAIVLSEAQRDFLRRYPPFAGIEFDVVPMPPPELPPRAPTSPARGPRLRIVSWGGLEPGKGIATLLEACRRLTPPDSVELHHHGRVFDSSFERELTAAADPVRLTLHGVFRPSDLPEFADYDLAVFPSHYLETHGYVVDEALALGLPVVVTDRGAPQERVGERGWVVPAADPGALARQLQVLLDDPSLLDAARRGEAPSLPAWSDHLETLAALYRR